MICAPWFAHGVHYPKVPLFNFSKAVFLPINTELCNTRKKLLPPAPMSALIDVKLRDEELYNAYKHAFRQPGMTHRQAIHTAIHTQTSRYWVSSIYVYRDILSRLRGYATPHDPEGRCKHHHPCRADMYDQLFTIYRRLARQRYFRGCSAYFLVSFVINRPAPRFYIDYRQAQKIIARKRKEAHHQYLQNLRRNT